MTSLLPHQELHEQNSSAIFDVWLVLRRQPWDQWARKALDLMKSVLQAALFAALLSAVLLPTMAQARTYECFSVDVPFRFYVGNRTFSPGHYDIIFVGPGLVSLRDAKAHDVASLVTRSIESGEPASESKLVFKTQKKHQLLSQIYIASRSQVVEIVGEELAIRTQPPLPSSALPNSLSFSGRPDGFRLRQ